MNVVADAESASNGTNSVEVKEKAVDCLEVVETKCAEALSPGRLEVLPLEEDQVTIITADGEKFFLSRRLLASGSHFFRALFNGNFADSKLPSVKLCRIQSKELSKCLAHLSALTRGTKPDLTLQEAIDLLTVASFLLMDDLLTELSDQIVHRATTYQILDAYRSSLQRHNLLSKKLWHTILVNFKALIETQEYLRMSEQEMIRAYSDEKLNILPKQEIPIANRWIEQNKDASTSQFQKFVNRNTLLTHSDGVLYPIVRNRIPAHIILALGGWSAQGPSAMIETYNTRNDRWQAAPQAFEDMKRSYHGLANVDNKIFVCGGFNGLEHYQHCRIYDINTRIWSDTSNMHERRCYVGCAPYEDSSGKHHVVAVGGFNGARRLETAEMFDVQRNHWFRLPRMHKGRSDLGCVVLGDTVMAVGGFDGRTIHQDTEELDLGAEKWLLSGASRKMRSQRTGVSAVSMEERLIYAIGGYNGVRRLRSAEFQDKREGIWHMLPELNVTRSNFGVELMEGQVYVAGGFDGVRTTEHTERLDIRTNRWEVLAPMTIAKSALKLIRITDHDIIKDLTGFHSSSFLE